MTAEEIYQKIYSINRNHQERDQKLTEIENLLPPEGAILSTGNFLEFLKEIRRILA